MSDTLPLLARVATWTDHSNWGWWEETFLEGEPVPKSEQGVQNQAADSEAAQTGS